MFTIQPIPAGLMELRNYLKAIPQQLESGHSSNRLQDGERPLAPGDYQTSITRSLGNRSKLIMGQHLITQVSWGWCFEGAVDDFLFLSANWNQLRDQGNQVLQIIGESCQRSVSLDHETRPVHRNMSTESNFAPSSHSKRTTTLPERVMRLRQQSCNI